MTALDPRTAQAITLADNVAAQMFERFRRRIPFDEIQSHAREAALDAARRWDGRGQFIPFAVQRIRWRVLNALRQRRRLGPRPAADDYRTAAGLATERAADALAHETDASGPVSIEEIGGPEGRDGQGATGHGTAGAGAAETSDRAAAMSAFLGRAAACFAIDLDAATPMLEIADPSMDVEAEVERMRVRRAVAALPPEQRAVVERHGYAGETFEEIAAALGERRSTVFSRFARALESLRKTLGVKRTE